MTLAAIADDLTGACDVGAELALAGHRVRVEVAPSASRHAKADDAAVEVVIVNTQSRSLGVAMAARRVRDALRERSAPLVLKKIDTALRGHLGAELDAALDMLDAPGFVVAAIPAAGRVTRNGCQWLGDRLLADTEFAHDPEGPGAVSSISEVIGRESGRKVAVLARALVCEQLATEVARGRRAGIDLFVVDAESDEDVRAAVAAILALGTPVCLAGSIALAAALAPHVASSGDAGPARGQAIALPVLIVNGSLHTRARAQVDAVLATGQAIALVATGAAEVAREAAAAIARGTSVVLAPAPAASVPTTEALRATETVLAETVAAIAATTPLATLVLIGGETSYAVLTRLAAGAIVVHGRIAPLVALGTIQCGVAAGATLITKGGSGGDPDVIAALLLGAEDRPRAGEGRV